MKFNDSGSRTKHKTGACRDKKSGKGRMDLLPARAIIELSKIYEVGANKYEERNWEKGIPVSSFIDSGLRHIMEFLEGDRSEPKLKMALWNIACAVDTIERIKEGVLPLSLFDVPGSHPESGVY